MMQDFQQGSGVELSPQVHRGDSFIATEGDHAHCDGRVEVVGPGVRLTGHPGVGTYHVSGGLLLRCQGCLKSFTWTKKDDDGPTPVV